MVNDPEREPDKPGDPSAAQQSANPSARPFIEGHKDDKGGDGENGPHRVTKEQDQPLHWTRYVEAACAIALVLITSTYTYYASRQATAALTAAHAAKSAADTANETLIEMQTNNKESAQFAERKFHIEQRPYLTATDIKSNSPISAGENRIMLGLFNTGKSPALNVRIEPSFYLGEKRLIENPSKRSESIVAADKPIFNTYTIEIIPNDNLRIATGTQLHFRFTVIYTDIFRDWHITQICTYYSPKEAAYKYCDKGNSVE